MNRRKGINIPSHFVLLFLAVICIGILFFSYASGSFAGPVSVIADYVFMPLQKGMSAVGDKIYDSAKEGESKKELIAENELLKAQVAELQSRLTNVQLQESELERLRELYKLDQSYSEYETTGAYVVGQGASNWFNTFTIDKGSADGIKKDMNVIAGSGLVGIIVDVGSHYSVVRSLINDNTNVSAMVISSGDNCIVSGNLERMNESNMIDFTGLEDSGDIVEEGDAIVTSNISNKYLKGILIGYISKIQDDSNDLTKSGAITPVVDFKHLKEVLVILGKKENGEVEGRTKE
ncbi:MAG: rod shape-determining protein MreC [Lachnospiraceae bacterium]|nr:rod shape-determining protein MreC [Lachnospiraceae bacterium]